MDFTDAVVEILVTEMCRTPEEAKELVAGYPQVMVNAMMSGLHNVRPAAMALEMAELRQKDAPFDPDCPDLWQQERS